MRRKREENGDISGFFFTNPVRESYHMTENRIGWDVIRKSS